MDGKNTIQTQCRCRIDVTAANQTLGMMEQKQTSEMHFVAVRKFCMYVAFEFVFAGILTCYLTFVNWLK